MANKRILVIGGTGYIGRCLVKKLISNYDVTLLVRRKLEDSKCKFFIGDLLDKNSMLRKISDFDSVINLASVIRTINKKKYEGNVVGLKNLVEVMERNKVKKVIYFSTQNVNLRNKGYYSRSKGAAENVLIDSNLDYMIIRPNYVYGLDKNNDFYKIARIISSMHIAPIIGNGNYKVQPVLKDDLVNVVYNFINNFKSRSIIEVSGNDIISMNEIIGLISKNLGVNPLKVHIPISILRLLKFIVPFDVDGFTEDKISKNPFTDYKFSSFSNNLKKITMLVNKRG